MCIAINLFSVLFEVTSFIQCCICIYFYRVCTQFSLHFNTLSKVDYIDQGISICSDYTVAEFFIISQYEVWR